MVRVSSDGRAMATVGKDGLVVIYDVEVSKADEAGLHVRVRHRLRPHSSTVHDVSWSPSGKYLATSSDSGTFKIYQAETGKAVAKNNKHTRAVKGMVWMDEEDKFLLTGGLDSKIRLWSVDKLVAQQEGALPDHEWTWSAVASLLLSRSLNKVLVRSLSESHHSVRVYDCENRDAFSE